jgi:hypothetical protein
MWVVWLVFLRGKRGSIAAIVAIVFRGEEESPMLSPCIYNPYKCAGVFRHWTKAVLTPLLGYLRLVSNPILP